MRTGDTKQTEVEVVLENRPTNPRRNKKEPRIVEYGGTEDVAVARTKLGGDLSGWTLSADFRLDAGEVIHGDITLHPEGRVVLGSMSQRAYRRLSLHAVQSEIEAGLSRLESAFRPLGMVPALPTWIDALKAGRNPGKRGQDARWYLEWARRRIEAQDKAPRRPIKWLVEQYPGYTEYAVNELIREARKRKLLTKPPEPVGWGPVALELLKKEGLDGLD